MIPLGAWLRCPAGMLGLGLALLAPLAAQHRLYVMEPDGHYHVVLKVTGNRPIIMDQGELVAARGQRFALRKAEEYLPVFIKVLAKDAGSTALIPVTPGPSVPTRLNSSFNFSARFESSAPLADVFLVLALDTENLGQNFLVWEIGALAAGVPKPVSVSLPLEKNPGPGQFSLLLFSGGDEVFSSEQPADMREALLDQMIAKRIVGVQQSGPRPFFGEAPAYPAALRPTGLKGEAVVTMRISPSGRVLDSLVESATHPAFGLAALEVVPQWRFLPRVQAGQAVETKVKLPLAFDPPDAAGAGKN
jgi:TonB family protein